MAPPRTSSAAEHLRDCDDLSLLDLWRLGENEAAAILLQRHFAEVYRYFESRVPPAAEDLTQRTFLACIESRDRFDARQAHSFRSYLFGIARKHLLRFFDKHRRSGRDGEAYRWWRDRTETTPSQGVKSRDEARELRAAMQGVSDPYRTVLELHYWRELSLEEIADAVGVRVGTVKSRLHRGRAMLRRCIADRELECELP